MITQLPRPYKTLPQQIYAEMDRQSAAGQHDPDILDRMHELQQRGIAFTPGESVQSVRGPNIGKFGTVDSAGLTTNQEGGPRGNQVLYADGTGELLPNDNTQRDFVTLAAK